MDEVELIGHRGYREWIEGLPVTEQTPENSIEAFTKSFSPKGLDGVELDVHLSRDDKLVVFHDDDLNELTDVADLLRQPIPADGPDPLANVRGVDLTRLRALQANDPDGNGKIYVADLNLSEIQALRLKTHPDPDGVRHTAEGHAIPTLTQVFEAVDTARTTNPSRPFKITIEVKEASMLKRRETDWAVITSDDGQSQRVSKDIAGAVTDTVKDFLEGPQQVPWSKADNLVVSSFHKMTLGRLRAADPDIPRSALYSRFEERDFRISDDRQNLEMKDPKATDWTIARPALATDHLFNAAERVWDMTEGELKQAIDADAQTPIVDFDGKPLTGRDGQPLVGVNPQNVSISISEMTEGVADKIRSMGAEVSVWTANEQEIDRRPAQERAELFDFLQAHGVSSFITDNSNNMVLERDAWLEQRRQAARPPSPAVEPAPAPTLAETNRPGPSVDPDPARGTSIPRQRRSRSPAPVQTGTGIDETQRTSPVPPAPPQHTYPPARPQRRHSIHLVPDDLPDDARPFNPDGTTPWGMYGRAAFANGAAQTVAMCIAYGVALSYLQVFAERVIPNEGLSLGKTLGRAVAQGLLQAPFVAVLEESIFGLGAEAWAAALGGAVVPRSDPYPEFKIPQAPSEAFPANQDAATQNRWHEAVGAHNRALEYARTHGGIEPSYEARNHPFSRLALHPEQGAANYAAELARWNQPDQQELRRKAEGILRNHPLELSDYPVANDLAPSHVTDERQQWLLERHNAEVAYANDVIGQPEYGELEIDAIPARDQDAAAYDDGVEQAREFLQQRSRKLSVGRMAFAQDQRSADYGSLPIDIVLIGAFAVFAGASAAVLHPQTLKKAAALQTVPGTTLAGTAFGAGNNIQRLQNRHRPDRLSDTPEPDVRQAGDQVSAERGGVSRVPAGGIPTHYVRNDSGVRHGWEVFKEIWNGIGDSERLSDGVLGARNRWEKARNQGQQLVSYVIGSSYGLVAYSLVRAGLDHAFKGSQGWWQSLVRETVATAAFVGCGDLSILHQSIYGRRGVTGVNPAFAATGEAFADLWKSAAARGVYSTFERGKLNTAVNYTYDFVQKALRTTQHGVMDLVNVVLTKPATRYGAAERSAETREWYGQEGDPRPTVYGQLSYKEREEVAQAARTTAITSLFGDQPVPEREVVKRLEVLRGKADKFWDAQQKLEQLWQEIGPNLAAQLPAPLQPTAQGATPPPQTAAELLDRWQPTADQQKRCDEVLRDLKEGREAIDILRRAEVNVRDTISEQVTRAELRAIVVAQTQAAPITPAPGAAPPPHPLTELLQRRESGINHELFERMLDDAIRVTPGAAQSLNRQTLLDAGNQGINERTVSMVSRVMADLLKTGAQQTNDVAAVMETLIDDAHRTGMTRARFAQVVGDQFHAAAQAQGVTQDQANRLTQARPTIVQRANARFDELGNNAHRRGELQNVEKALRARPPGARR